MTTKYTPRNMMIAELEKQTKLAEEKISELKESIEYYEGKIALCFELTTRLENGLVEGL